MKNFDKAMKLLNKLEFNSAKNFLHQNKNEGDLTVGGIYKFANPKWIGWETVKKAITVNNGYLTDASLTLYYNDPFRTQVNLFYKKEYWDKMQLDKVDSLVICSEIFLFGVNAGRRTAIRKAQNIIGVKPDGLIGPNTISALNCVDEEEFSFEFDKLEMKYYSDIIAQKPSFKIFENGWKNRAYSV